jgi:hypothetical protein
VTGGVGGTGEGSVDVEVEMDIQEEGRVDVEDTLDGKEEGSINFEAVYIKEEIPECPQVKTEHEVSLCFQSIYCSKNLSVKLHLQMSCFVVLCSISFFKTWIYILKRRQFL